MTYRFGGQASVPGSARRRRHGAQSLVEFALVLPIMLALVGVTIDVARVYQTWVNLESASRSAAERLASNVDKTVTAANAGGKAKEILEAESKSAYTVAGSVGACQAPTVSATYAARSDLVGASLSNPIGTATVSACVPFRPLFAYPLLTIDGSWILRSEQTFAIVQGR